MESPVRDYGRAIELMRSLRFYGVTHFVLEDWAYEGFGERAKQTYYKLGLDLTDPMEVVPAPTEALCFKGHRLLRQSDLEHLPFDPSPGFPKGPTIDQMMRL